MSQLQLSFIPEVISEEKSKIFTKRTLFKPFEYDVTPFKDAIRHSYWVHTEFNLTSDIQDFSTLLSNSSRNAIKNALLAISQIEISVKKFWTRLGDKIEKPEFDQIGVTFGESEVRHADAYSFLLKQLGLDEEFDKLKDIPEIEGRVKYLSKYLKQTPQSNDQNYAMSLSLFSIFIENVSLFAQFYIIKSFNKKTNTLKGVDNIVQATQKEELIHAQFGMWLINKIKEENPSWFNGEFYEKLYRAARKTLAAEEKIIDWIFEQGELEFLPKIWVKEMIKDRLNESLRQIGGLDIFDIDPEISAKYQWFKDEIYADTNVDFFYKKSTNYSKNVQSYNEEDLF